MLLHHLLEILVLNFFYLINVKHIIWITCSSNFIWFGSIDRILELSKVVNLFLANPVFHDLGILYIRFNLYIVYWNPINSNSAMILLPYKFTFSNFNDKWILIVIWWIFVFRTTAVWAAHLQDAVSARILPGPRGRVSSLPVPRPMLRCAMSWRTVLSVRRSCLHGGAMSAYPNLWVFY